MSLEYQCICGACEDCLDAIRRHEDAVIAAEPRPSVPPEEPQDFAEEMRAQSWKHWTDAHPAEEPPRNERELVAVSRFELNHLRNYVVALDHDPKTKAAAKDLQRWIEERTARPSVASLSSQLERLREDWENREAAMCPEDVGFEEYIKSLESSLERLKAESLTPEEAELLLDDIHHDDDCATRRGFEPEDCNCQSEPIIEKLRRLSQSDTGDTQ